MSPEDFFGPDRILRGFGKYDCLGQIDDRVIERNRARANRDGLDECDHCGRGVRPESEWYAAGLVLSERWIRLDVEPALLAAYNAAEDIVTTDGVRLLPDRWEWIRLGPECAKNLPLEYRIEGSRFVEVWGATWAGAMGWRS